VGVTRVRSADRDGTNSSEAGCATPWRPVRSRRKRFGSGLDVIRPPPKRQPSSENPLGLTCLTTPSTNANCYFRADETLPCFRITY
jgi:hypothetical protein